MVLALPGHLDAEMFDDWLDDVVHHHGQTLLRFHAVLALASRTGPLGTEVYRGVRGHLEHDFDPRRNSQPAEAGPINRLAPGGRGLDLVELESSLSGCLVA